MADREPDEMIWKSYVWHDKQCFFVSTIERTYSTCAGLTRGYETLVWEFDWDNNKRGKWIHQAGGIAEHQQICRCLIAEGVVPDEGNPKTERFLKLR